MNILGISEGFHDAAICLIRNSTKIHYASSSERYSGIKNDKWVHKDQLPLSESNRPNVVAYYEKPFRKNLRRLYAGQKWQTPRIKYDWCYGHHESHFKSSGYTTRKSKCAKSFLIFAFSFLKSLTHSSKLFINFF